MADNKEVTSHIRIADYDYPLPQERIAQHPLKERDRCLLLRRSADGAIDDHRFDALPELLPPTTLMICNNTRVINARMCFHKSTGARIEVFLLEPDTPSDYALMFQSRGRCVWQCMIGNLKRWKDGELEQRVDHTTLRARRLETLGGGAHRVELSWDDETKTLADIVEAAGKIPIPPYLNRDTEESDSDDYQTVYSKMKGSVAAPTAGLHFTERVLEELSRRGIERRELTLHVGAGTFQPVKAEEIGDHPMHTETYSITRATLGELIAAVEEGRPVTAVGTTSVRTIESLPYAGARIAAGLDSGVTQWEAYSPETQEIDTLESLRALARHLDEHGLDRFTSSTSIMIAPGFRWRLVDVMVTNFHQPESTLLLLVSSFMGDKPGSGEAHWREVYNHALRGDYRFLSYGDACLFFRPK